MKNYLMLLLVILSGGVYADCAAYACKSVKVEAFVIGKASPLIRTSGNEEQLECNAFYQQLSMRLADDTYGEMVALLKLANKHDLLVDIELSTQFTHCTIESVVVYSSKE